VQAIVSTVFDLAPLDEGSDCVSKPLRAAVNVVLRSRNLAIKSVGGVKL
jgi:hypothetical protein